MIVGMKSSAVPFCLYRFSDFVKKAAEHMIGCFNVRLLFNGKYVAKMLWRAFVGCLHQLCVEPDMPLPSFDVMAYADRFTLLDGFRSFFRDDCSVFVLSNIDTPPWSLFGHLEMLANSIVVDSLKETFPNRTGGRNMLDREFG